MKEYWEKSLTCPLCSTKFLAKQLRSSAYTVEKRDTDFHVNYQGVNPLWYQVIVCPNCFYAAYKDDYEKISFKDKEGIKNATLINKSDFSGEDFLGIRELNTVIKSFQFAIRCYSTRTSVASREVLGGLNIRIAWLYRETGDISEEKKYLSPALENYLLVFEKGGMLSSKLGEIGLTYLIGELYNRLGDYEKAVRWFSQVVGNPNIKAKPEIERMARDQWYQAREALKEQK